MRLTIGGTNRRELTSHQTVSGSMPVVLCVVFDTTGSMLSYIEGLINCVKEMTRSMALVGIEWSMTVVPFGDLRISGDTINTDFPWVSTVCDVSNMLDSMPRNSGGGNGGESAFEAIDASVGRLRDRSDAAKVLLLLTDEGAHHDNFSDDEIAAHLVKDDVLVYAVAPSSHDYYNRFALITGGEFLEISSQVDLSVVTSKMTHLGRKIAERANQVMLTGGSPQRLLALETGQ